MKTKLFLILIIFLAFSCQNTPKEESKKTEETTNALAKVNVQKVELNIEGMTCTGCENTIQNTINKFDGVYSAKADHVKGIAIVEIDSTKVDISKIEEAINQTGYKAIGHQKLSE